jgi:hypothetical protein
LGFLSCVDIIVGVQYISSDPGVKKTLNKELARITSASEFKAELGLSCFLTD